MSTQPKYVLQPDFDTALIAISGHIDHSALLAKAEIRREINSSEDRLSAKFDAKFDALNAKIDTVKTELQTQIDDLTTRVDRVEHMGKLNHQMLQLVLDQLSKINKKLGVD